MSDFTFALSTAAIGFLGLALAVHLLFFGSGKLSAKLLGWYTLVLTLSSVEPLKDYLSTTYWVGIIIGTGAFMIGPMLYLYSFHRISGITRWKWKNILHFLPATLLLVMMVLTPRPDVEPADSETDVILYLLFVTQLFSYTFLSLFQILKAKRLNNLPSALEQFHLNFMLILVISSLVLFGYSFISTLAGANDSFHFKISIQAFLTLVILVIVFLNAETLEDHGMIGKTKKIFRRNK